MAPMLMGSLTQIVIDVWSDQRLVMYNIRPQQWYSSLQAVVADFLYSIHSRLSFLTVLN